MASLDLADLLDGAWRPGCLLLVMPGGADLPYCRHLDGRGNTLIRGAPLLAWAVAWAAGRRAQEQLQAAGADPALDPAPGCTPPTTDPVPLHPAALLLPAEYVEGGGAYLGLCAGAYYASARVEFEPGSR